MSSTSPLRSVQLVSGAGGMYCGSCMHGNTLARALIEAGHDAMLVPLYTPLRTDEQSVRQEQLAFGGLNVFLQQKFPLFRKTPAFIDRLLDRPGLVRWMSRWGGRTDATQLGALTVSMLRGESGRQSKELEKLLGLLTKIPDIDVIHLSNVLLAGLAGPIRESLNVPVVVSLTGEDVFIEKLPEPYATETRVELQRCAQHIDAFIAMNTHFADQMTDYLSVPRQKIHVIPPGINLTGHGTDSEAEAAKTTPGSFRIGYFSRICYDKGLHLLVDALEIVAKEAQSAPSRSTRRVTWALRTKTTYATWNNDSKRTTSVDDFAIPDLPTGPPRSISSDRSMSSACPRYSPRAKASRPWRLGPTAGRVSARAGAFPELVTDTGGGVLFDPNDAKSLARVILELADDRDRMAELGRRGQEAVRNRYHDTLMAERTAAVYSSLAEEAR